MPPNVPPPVTYQLFSQDGCDPSVPVNSYVEEYDFGQFLNLILLPDGKLVAGHPQKAFPIVVAPSADENRSARLRHIKGRTITDVVGGIPLQDVLAGDVRGALAPPQSPRTLIVRDLDTLLATRELPLKRDRVKVELTPAATQRLLENRPALVKVETGSGEEVVMLLPTEREAFASQPMVSRWVVEDLSVFLLRPDVPGVDGKPFRLSLTPDTIQKLRVKGYAEVDAGKKSVEVFLKSSCIAPEYSASLIMGKHDRMPPDYPDPDDPEPPKDGGNGRGQQDNTSDSDPQASTSNETSLTTSTEPKPDDPFEPTGEPSPQGFQIALLLPWRQRWNLLGYSRGRLLNSLTLAPQEETVIELFTWDRRRRTLEQSSSTDSESSYEQTDTTKDSFDVYSELTKGGEFFREAGMNFTGLYGSPQASYVKLDANGKLSGKDSVNRVARNTAQHLQDSVTKAASRVKVLRTSKISETIESGREDKVTRKIKNPNMCHTLSLDYFELLANYDVTTVFVQDDAVLVALVPNPLANLVFDRRTIRIYEKALRNALLDPNLADGFAAGRLLRARELSFQVACDRYHCEPLIPPGDKTNGPDGGPQSNNGALTVPEWPPVQSLLQEIFSIANQLKSSRPEPMMEAYDDKLHPSRKPSANESISARRWLFMQLMFRYQPSLFEAIGNAEANLKGARRLFTALPSPDSAYRPNNFSQVPEEERQLVFKSVLQKYSDKPFEENWYIKQLSDDGILIPADGGLSTLLDQFSSAYTEYVKAVNWDTPAGSSKASASPSEQQSEQDKSDRLEFSFPMRDVALALEREEALKGHLQEHANYYRYAVFQAMPPSQQLERLTQGYLGTLSPDLFEPRVASWRSDKLAIPLNVDVDEKLQHFFVDLISDVAQNTKNLTRTLALPTPGISIETRRGKCTGCDDFIEQTRTIELRQRRATAEQADLETQRLKDRLGSQPPLLNDPQSNEGAVRIRLEDNKPAPR